ncbi:glycosyltransferase [Halobacillus litoralis]|uniref:Glycosyltransferase n=1 Tax=Halobacillus litoralis TaxID=45668 RepID=A0A845F7R0_9BACI|nr:glycosyltransferase family A protein [Halobacillus litoralis]MYL69824.1 glycosyltransferase [Halobacillus litoralis]
MKVSVVIPTHNRASLLTKAVESVLKQSYQNLEVLVVSDGSTDNTDSLLEEYEKKDSRIKYISYQPAKGGNHARNTGIKAAEGDYIAFIDDDDEWVYNKIELQVQEFNKDSRYGLVYTGAKILYDDKGINYISTPQKTGDLSDDILISNCIGSTSSVMVKKSVLEEVGGFDEELKAQQDYDLWIRVCQNFMVGAVSEPLLIYHNYGNNTQISDSLKKYEESIDYISLKYKELYKDTSEKIRRDHNQASYKILITKALRNNEPKKARKYLLAHFRQKPSFFAISFFGLSFLKFETVLKLRSLKNLVKM